MRKQGDKVRITAQLIKAADGFHVWSDTFTRELKDIFAVQDEIAGLIAKNLSLKLGASSAASKAAVNPEAFELYVQARQAWNRRSSEGFDLAESLLSRALATEPDFARAHAALADVWTHRWLRTLGEIGTKDQSISDEKERIRATIRHALTLDPNSAEAHASIGLVLQFDAKPSEAESALRRAIVINPNYAPAHIWFSLSLVALARMDDALAHARIATERAPLSPAAWDAYGTTRIHAGRFSEGVIAGDRALALQLDFTRALNRKSEALVNLGRFTEAIAVAKQVPSVGTYNKSLQCFVFALGGLKAEAETLFAELRTDAIEPPYTVRSLIVPAAV